MHDPASTKATEAAPGFLQSEKETRTHTTRNQENTLLFVWIGLIFDEENAFELITHTDHFTTSKRSKNTEEVLPNMRTQASSTTRVQRLRKISGATTIARQQPPR